MNQKESLKQGLTLIWQIKTAMGRLSELVQDDAEGDNINECLKQNYPFQHSLDEVPFEEWIGGYEKRMYEILDEQRITLTYEIIKKTVGWQKFADVTNRDVNEVKHYGEPANHVEYEVSRGQAKQLGFPVQ